MVTGQIQEALPVLRGKLARHLPVPCLAQVRAKSFSKVCQNTKNLPEAFCIPLSTHLPTNTTAARKCLSLPSQPEEACEFGDVGMRGCARYTVWKGRLKQMGVQRYRHERQGNMAHKAFVYLLSCTANH